MISVRNEFRLKFGTAKDAIELFKDLQPLAASSGREWRALADITGPAYTVISEGLFDDLGSFESEAAKMFSDPEWQKWYSRFKPLCEFGKRTIYRVVSDIRQEGSSSNVVMARNAFQIKFGMMKHVLEAMKKFEEHYRTLTIHDARILTDYSGPSYTLVLETCAPSLAAIEEMLSRSFSDPSWQIWYEEFKTFCVSSTAEYYRILK